MSLRVSACLYKKNQGQQIAEFSAGPPTLVLPLIPSRKLLPLGCRARYAIGSDLIFPGPEMLQTRDGWIRTRVLCDKGIISCTTLNVSQLLICCKNSAVEMLWMWVMVFKLGQGAVH